MVEWFKFWIEIKSEYYQTENLENKIEAVEEDIELVYIDEIDHFVKTINEKFLGTD